MPSNELSQKAPASLLGMFRALLKQREEEVRASVEDDNVGCPSLSIEEWVQLYELLLYELTFNSKPIITDLTIIAGKLRAHGESIADAICARIVEVPVDQKLPLLYLLDGIVKNIGRESVSLPVYLSLAYKQVHPNLYPSMRYLFGTWSTVFPPSVLCKIETQLQFSPQISSQPSLKASDLPRPAHGIHVNPKYVCQLEHSTSDNNVLHVIGVSSTVKIFSQKPTVGYDGYDSDHADVTSAQVGAQRLNTMGSVGHTSFALGANKLHPSSCSSLARHLSPSTVGAQRPLPSDIDDFATGNSPRRFVDGSSQSHPAFEYGPVGSIGRDEETNEWSRKHYLDDSHKRFEASIAYNLSNGHERQGPRELIDAYGEDKRNRIPNAGSLQSERLDVDSVPNSGAPRSWQNTEEEEFDWEDMSPTLADHSRSNNFLTASVPPFQGSGARPGFVTRGVSRLESDIRISQTGQARISLIDDSSNISEDAVPILGSSRESTGMIPGFQTERNQIIGSHCPQEAWKLAHHFPQSTDPLNIKGSREFQLSYSRSGILFRGRELGSSC